jgi:hypothetical protein
MSVELSVHFPGKVFRDALDVFHERDGIFEDVVIDALEDVTHSQAVLIRSDAKGIIDMTAAMRFGFQQIAVNPELAGDSQDVVFQGHALLSG